MKDERTGAVIQKLVELKPEMYSLLVDDISEHKKGKDVNRNVVATISHGEYEDVLLNDKCLRHLMNRIQSNNHRIAIYEIKKKKNIYHALLIKYTFKQ